MLEECEEWRAKMIEAAAEGDEALLNKYLESGELTDEEIKQGLRERALKNEICLVHLRLGVQEQGRAGRARRRSSSTCPRPSKCRRSRARASAASR